MKTRRQFSPEFKAKATVEMRLSERRFYQKVIDLYATAFDYDRST